MNADQYLPPSNSSDTRNNGTNGTTNAVVPYGGGTTNAVVPYGGGTTNSLVPYGSGYLPMNNPNTQAQPMPAYNVSDQTEVSERTEVGPGFEVKITKTVRRTHVRACPPNCQCPMCQAAFNPADDADELIIEEEFTDEEGEVTHPVDNNVTEVHEESNNFGSTNTPEENRNTSPVDVHPTERPHPKRMPASPAQAASPKRRCVFNPASVGPIRQEWSLRPNGTRAHHNPDPSLECLGLDDTYEPEQPTQPPTPLPNQDLNETPFPNEQAAMPDFPRQNRQPFPVLNQQPFPYPPYPVQAPSGYPYPPLPQTPFPLHPQFGGGMTPMYPGSVTPLSQHPILPQILEEVRQLRQDMRLLMNAVLPPMNFQNGPQNNV